MTHIVNKTNNLYNLHEMKYVDARNISHIDLALRKSMKEAKIQSNQIKIRIFKMKIGDHKFIKELDIMTNRIDRWQVIKDSDLNFYVLVNLVSEADMPKTICIKIEKDVIAQSK